MLKAQRKGKVDSWGIRWYLSVFMIGGLILYPVRSLVENIGFDDTGTHCGTSGQSGLYAITFTDAKSPIIRFPGVSMNKEVNQKVRLILSSKSIIMAKLRSLFSKIFGV